MNYQQFIPPETQFYHLSEPFHLESGAVLWDVQIAYQTWGQLNVNRDNAVWICHALTGWPDAADWWESLFGTGKAFDPDIDFVVCSNVLGSCYGTTGPTSLNLQTGKPYGAAFPEITVRDMVRLQAVLLEALSIQRLKLAIGGSLGGMQVLEWALLYPEKVAAIALIAASGKHSAWCIGLSEAQRQAIYADPAWQNGNYAPTDPPAAGLAVARMIAMNLYRSWASFEERFGRQRHIEQPGQPYAIASYLHHQGQKLVERFDANTYVRLTQAMDSHDVSRDRGEYAAVLAQIHQPALIVAIDSDILYPPIEQQELAALMPAAQLQFLYSRHGHDAFLIDMDALNDLIVSFCRSLLLHDGIPKTVHI
ncbi:homoserine O-acetyltransferase [Phormidium tenue FACHB-886]|nr:homoserine O-acetyltransferase [Phormidium tenue FACHB-886]